MKHKTVILTLLLLYSLSFKAQEVEDSIPKSYDLKAPQYGAWKAIEQEWFAKEYHKILKENKLKMNCNGCSSIYMIIVITIDSTGKLTDHKVIKSRKCGDTFSKKLEDRFMKFFIDLKFPQELYNSKFEISLGTSLKC